MYRIERVLQDISLLTDSLLTSFDEIINRFPSYLVTIYSIFLQTLQVEKNHAIKIYSRHLNTRYTLIGVHTLCICLHICVHMYICTELEHVVAFRVGGSFVYRTYGEKEKEKERQIVGHIFL